MTFGVERSLFKGYVDSIREKYVSNESAPDIATPAWQVGALNAKARASCPLVAFRRTGGRVQSTSHAGIHEYTDGGSTIYFVPKYEEIARVDVTITARSWMQLDCIWSGLLAASRTALGIYSTPGEYRHLTESEDDPVPLAQNGQQLMVQSFEWRIQIPHFTGTLTEIQAITGSTTQLDINDAGTAGATISQT